MRFLVDEARQDAVADRLTDASHDASHVRLLGLAGHTDDEVMALAMAEERVLITTDTNFGTILALTGAAGPNVLLLRGIGDSVDSPAAGSGEINCGYIGGFPFGEVFETTEVDTNKTYMDFELDPVTLDATRDLSTTSVIGSYDGISGPGDLAGGVGEVRIIGTISAKIDGARTTLHSFDVTELTNPAEDTHEFVLTQDLGDEFDRVEADEFQLVLTVRGVHVAHGFIEVNGSSHVDVPTRPHRGGR